jgi:hypothetical protein
LPADEKPAFPEFDAVTVAVAEHFRQSKTYRPDDIVTAGDVSTLFPKLEKLGWKVADQKKIQQQLLPDNDDMVKRLRTPKGRVFMQHVGKMPLGYDRLDRLRRMPHGQYRIRELVDAPKGWEMIEYMTTTPNGKNLGKQLTNATDGKDFNRPTGKLYTERALVDRLQKSYDAESARKSKTAKPAK